MTPLKIVYQDKEITITPEFIRFSRLQDTIIRTSLITRVQVKTQVYGNFRRASPLFFLLGTSILYSIPVGLFFIASAIASLIVRRVRYVLILELFDVEKEIQRGSRYHLRGIANTINGIILSNQIKQ
jgi:ABC-type thiamin/hydroxymethylpyrimidine transport system permease subunit